MLKKLSLGLRAWLCAGALAGLPAGARAGSLLTVQVDAPRQLLRLTWPNLAEGLQLQEAPALAEAAWRNSARPARLHGGERRVLITGISQRAEWFRAAGDGDPAPALRLERVAGDNLHVFWDNAPGFRLQSKPPEGGWQDVDTESFVIGGEFELEVPLAGEASFFRLSQPLNHVLIVGQSLAIGAYAGTALSVFQPYQNKMFRQQGIEPGTEDVLPDDLSGLVPLVENFDPSRNVGETLASGFANGVSARVGRGRHDLLVSNAGRGATGYAELGRTPPSDAPFALPDGTPPYLRGLAQIAAARRLSAPLGYVFRAVFAVHGESDNVNRVYGHNLRQWQRDYEADVHRLTGQTNRMPMFHTQTSAWGGLGDAVFNVSSFLMLAEHEANPDRTVLVGPKYFLPYADGLHLTAAGYRWLGEYYAKAYCQHVLLGQPWTPLRPVSVTRTGAVIEVTFTGNVGPLVLDRDAIRDPEGEIYASIGASADVLVAGHDAVADTLILGPHALRHGDELYVARVDQPTGLPAGRFYYVRTVPAPDRVTLAETRGGPRVDFGDLGSHVLLRPELVQIGPAGFEYRDSEGAGLPWRGATRIERVELAATNRVRLHLDREPTGANRRLRYAFTALPERFGGRGGPELGPRGCLRDSDPAPSRHGNKLYNWCVHFDRECP